MDDLLIVGIGGSLAANSRSLMALRLALDGATEFNARTELVDVREATLPFYSPQTKNSPKRAVEIAELVYRANGLIWSSPL